MKTGLPIIAITLARISSVNENAQDVNPNETTKRKADETLDKGLDKLEEGIGSIFKKKKSKDEKPNTSNPDNGSSTIGKNSSAKSKFDFEPGNQVLYFDDFKRLNIGDFPAEINTNASGEVANVTGKTGKWLSMTKNGAFIPENSKVLPENSTLEFEVGLYRQSGQQLFRIGNKFRNRKKTILSKMCYLMGGFFALFTPLSRFDHGAAITFQWGKRD